MGQSKSKFMTESKPEEELNNFIFNFDDFKLQMFGKYRENDYFIATLWGIEICFNKRDLDNFFVNKEIVIKFAINNKLESKPRGELAIEVLLMMKDISEKNDNKKGFIEAFNFLSKVATFLVGGQIDARKIN